MQRCLSLAVLIAAALGTSAPAGTAHNTAPVRVDRTAPPLAFHGSYSAVVAANGVLKRGNGAVDATQPEGKGTYAVSFVTDVTSCAYVVTIGETDSAGSQGASAATVVGRSGDATGVYVETFDAAGALANRPFHIDVGC